MLPIFCQIVCSYSMVIRLLHGFLLHNGVHLCLLCFFSASLLVEKVAHLPVIPTSPLCLSQLRLKTLCVLFTSDTLLHAHPPETPAPAKDNQWLPLEHPRRSPLISPHHLPTAKLLHQFLDFLWINLPEITSSWNSLCSWILLRWVLLKFPHFIANSSGDRYETQHLTIK